MFDVSNLPWKHYWHRREEIEKGNVSPDAWVPYSKQSCERGSWPCFYIGAITFPHFPRTSRTNDSGLFHFANAYNLWAPWLSCGTRFLVLLLFFISFGVPGSVMPEFMAHKRPARDKINGIVGN